MAIMRLRGKLVKLALAAVFLLLLAGGAAHILTRLLHLDSYREQIIGELQQALNRQVVYGKGEVAFRFGPTFTFTDVRVRERDGSRDLLRVNRLTFRLALFPLLEKKVVLREVVLDRPQITVARNKDGSLSIGDLLEEKTGGVPLLVREIKVKTGTFRFIDEATPPQPVVTQMDDVDLHLGHLGRGKTCDVRLDATVADGGGKGNLSINGKVRIPRPGKPWSDTVLDLTVKAKELDASRYWPYYNRYVPFRQIIARFSVDGTFRGTYAEFKSQGKMRITGLRFDYPRVFHSVLTPRDLHFSYDMELSHSDVDVKGLDLTVDGLNVRGSCAIRDIHSGDPRITAQAITSRFNLAYFAQYIPYGIIPKGPADFIEQHIKGGIYQLDSGQLDGRVSQILRMEVGENYNILSIRGRAEKGVLTFGPKVPTFTSVKGTVELRGKDFNLIGMSGLFGSSPFTLNGKIADYPLATSPSYPFSMAITPRPSEVSWLLGPGKGHQLAFSGDTQLRLKGSGSTDSYTLAGTWQLTPAAYSFPGIIDKPAGRTNSLSFSSTINKDEVRISNLTYHLTPMTLSAGATYQFAGAGHLKLIIGSNPISLTSLAPFLPTINEYQAAGRVQVSITGDGDGFDVKNYSWQGTAAFTDFSFKPTGAIQRISSMNGSINFAGNSLQTSQLTARVGNSTITGHGSLVDFNNPSFSLTFSSPTLYPADFGYAVPNRPLRFDAVQGTLSLTNDSLQLEPLSLRINRTELTLRGTVQDLNAPKADLTVESSYLDSSDILLLSELEPIRPEQRNKNRLDLKATLKADEGEVFGIPFEQLRTTVMYANRLLYVQPFRFSPYGGHATGQGRFDFGINGTPRYQLSFNLENVPADRLSKPLGFKTQEIKGNLSLSGELTTTGKTSAELKQNLLGSARLRIEEGSLRQFAILSKVFSILNISQLLKFQLPDMVSGGMPFNSVTATFSIRDGVISSTDLFVDSDAINISAVGKVDLPREELNVTIGVQPLQTVDKVVSKIPIVGWILTGKDRSLITTYFEAKGRLSDPQVTAIPVKSMAKGVFDIFKRVFELPAKLFTDTGEVIIGK